MTILPSLLRARIKEFNISEREASRRAKVSPTTIGRILRGESVDIDTLVKVCDWLGVNPSTVLDAYRPDDLRSRLSTLLQSRPGLEKVIQRTVDRIDRGELDPSVLDDVVAYIDYRTRENDDGLSDTRNSARSRSRSEST